MALLINKMKKLIFTSHKLTSSKAYYGSALFVTGDRRIEVCPVVFPYVDFADKLSNEDSLKETIVKRNLNVDVNAIKDVWDFFHTIKQNCDQLEQQKQNISQKIHQLKSSEENTEKDNLKKYLMHLQIVKQDLANLKSGLWSIEEKAIIQALAFPNSLHAKTPTLDQHEIYRFNEKSDLQQIECHLDIGTKADLLKFTSPQNYYLKNEAAIFELCGKFYFSKNLRNAGYTQFSNPDFTKSAVVEGCGLNHTDPDKVFILHHNEPSKVSEDSRLHLTGGGSLLAFAAYHTKNVVLPGAFPLKYFSLGRQYLPVTGTSDLGLFCVSQSSAVQLFIAVKDSLEDLDRELDNATTLVTEIYKNMGYHFRVCYVPARQLENWETLRVSFQMFSPSLDTYIEVGNISVSDDYVSKRLHFNYVEGKKKFPKLISGTVLSIPKLLGCVLELSPETFQIPPILRECL